MKSINRITRTTLWLASALFIASAATAQQNPQLLQPSSNAYNVARETVLTGTVVSYSVHSGTPPIGAHLMLQTSSGVVDIHVGNGKLLNANRMTLAAGDSVRITGENVPFADGTFFAARIVQKGTQSVAIRNTKGFLLQHGNSTPAQAASLRGVR
jgi:hypothetical protein